jgi:putative two-component system response regulator
MNDEDIPASNGQATEIEPIDEISQPESRPEDILRSAEYEEWRKSALNKKVPSLFLDKRLKILAANTSFCRLFACDDRPSGLHFTGFFTPFFDEKKSSELFKAVLSPQTGFSWSGRVEKLGLDQLMTISKVWVVPILTVDSPAPKAYSAFCLDMTIEYRQLLQNTFAALLQAARLKDNDTGNHIKRVNMNAAVLAAGLLGRPEYSQVDRQFVDSIGQVAALHDIGKIGTPDDILNKMGRLESWEWDIMKQHTTNGAYILSTYPNPMAREIALRHHERWDGSGYPHQLSGDLIPLSARIVAFADVYDALRMARAYKEAYSHEKTLRTIEQELSTHFDPQLFQRFLGVAGEFEKTFTKLADRS